MNRKGEISNTGGWWQRKGMISNNIIPAHFQPRFFRKSYRNLVSLMPIQLTAQPIFRSCGQVENVFGTSTRFVGKPAVYFWLILTIFFGGVHTNLGVERNQRGLKPPTPRALFGTNSVLLIVLLSRLSSFYGLSSTALNLIALSLESNTISFYSVTFHSTFQHFHRYTTGFCPWASSLFVVHKPGQSNLYKWGFNFISLICWWHANLHFIFTQSVSWKSLLAFLHPWWGLCQAHLQSPFSQSIKDWIPHNWQPSATIRFSLHQ